ncbi:MAG: hypothetical protein M3Y24_12245 [Acidobacteriota bacterium]|nr:hypothetical protein [Acidobacteriota bacterium]
MPTCTRLIWLLVCGSLASQLSAQLVVKLKPETVAEFERYAQGVETQLNDRWQGKKSFLCVEDDPDVKKRVLDGEIFIKQMSGGSPVAITNGLVHDWLGAVFIPGTSIKRVLGILQDFDNHKNIYPEVADSRTIHRTANDVTGYWRLQQKGMVPIVLNVEQDAHYAEVAPGKWKCEAYARKITEIDMSLFTRGRKFPLGEGHGYLWRLYAYWSLETYNGGVLAECRTLSLSRDIPQGLAWAVGPYVDKMPEDSITSTLRETRRAASKGGKVQ